MKIACLHTAETNVAVFDAVAAALARADVDLSHHLRADLLKNAEAAGSLTPEIVAETRAALEPLTGEADAVLLTCSTVGPGIEGMEAAPVPVLRVDTALAEAAVAKAGPGGLVIVLCAVVTTVEPTRALFERVAAPTGCRIETRLVPDAWDRFGAGDPAGYHRLVADAADAAFSEGHRVVALAQASMAGAAALCTKGTPLASPEAGLRAAIASVG